MNDKTALDAVLADRADAVNDALRERLHGETAPELYEAARYLLEAGGKRIRPVLVLLTAEACAETTETVEVDQDAVMPAALAVEFVHTLSLIHDDIIDDDPLRRGVDSVHKHWDTSTGILAGDLLYSQALDVLLEVDAAPERRRDCARVLTASSRELCEGQTLDLEFTGANEVTEDEYLEMVEKKTGALFRCATEIGAILGGADDELQRELAAYGRKLGVAFQLYDDILDLTGSTDRLGKTRGSDLEEGKETLVAIHARAHGVEVANGVKGDDLESYVSEFEAVGSIEYTRERAESYVQEAKGHLGALSPSETREHLDALTEFTVDRDA